jgi:hypothetical protein
VSGKDLTLVVEDVQHHVARDQKGNFTTLMAGKLSVEYDAIDLIVSAIESYFEGKIQTTHRHEEDWHKDAVLAFGDEQHPLHNAIKKRLEDSSREFNLPNVVSIYQTIKELPEAAPTS